MGGGGGAAAHGLAHVGPGAQQGSTGGGGHE